eukprot:1162147-Pelagomonas_calceolata.AAC.7
MGSHTKKTSGQIGRVHLSSSSKLWGTEAASGNTFPALYGVTDCFSNKSSSLCNTLLASGRALHYVRVSAAPCSAESKC